MNLLTIAAATAALAVSPHTKVLSVTNGSMAPTLHPGDHILAGYDAFEPQLLDIVVFHPPLAAADDSLDDACGDRSRHSDAMCAKAQPGLSRQLWLKRIVGLPGDRLKLRNGRLWRNGRTVDEPFITPCDGDCDFPRTIVVPRGRYMLMGDNRGLSYDSRDWGPVPKSALVARADECDPQPAVGCPPR
ncbi:signal peptidase I [Solirubrobacter soli]|uniref:signal peptidase I n=1 Tax=Solirubrobacter soli TaxID=363832 RepID=UPI00041CCC9C|nr:signal peptidase I [Solirubrobacter soli]